MVAPSHALSFVREADLGLPLSEPALQQPVGVGQGAVVVVGGGGEQPR